MRILRSVGNQAINEVDWCVSYFGNPSWIYDAVVHVAFSVADSNLMHIIVWDFSMVIQNPMRFIYALEHTQVLWYCLEIP